MADTGDECYVVVIEERHTDVGVEVFINADEAIERAKAVVSEYASDDSEIDDELTRAMSADGWIYNCGWGSEGDAVRVVRQEIH